MDTIANNLSNINTTGFKPSQINFQDMLYSVLTSPGATVGQGVIPNGIQIGHGTKVAEISRNFQQGALRETGRDLDLAIEGSGFFEIVLPDGSSAYTRDGSFRRTGTGEVVTVDGYRVANFDTIDEGTTDITIAPDGSFSTSGQRRVDHQGRHYPGPLSESGRPSKSRTQSIQTNRIQWRRTNRLGARRKWRGHAGPSLCGTSQRPRRGRTRKHDSFSARLRGQLQSHQSQRRNDGSGKRSQEITTR